jgi:polar amino acid transport system permease protein
MNWERFVDVFANAAAFKEYLPSIVSGTLMTLKVALLIIVTGVFVGLLLAALRSYRSRSANFVVVVYVDVFRSLPPLVILLLVYFGLPAFGIKLSPFVALWLVLSAVLAAFAEEIFWAGIISVGKGQWDSARATGLNFSQTLLFVIIPQALRLTIPPLTNRTIAITKNSALGTVIGVPEILNEATTAQSFSGSGTPLLMGAVAYLIIFIPLVVVARRIERRYSWSRS